jgi:serine phosphatase RsbU (regulator of sigma subunit)
MPSAPKNVPTLPLLGGALLLASGLWSAFAVLPEWRRPAPAPGLAARVRAGIEALGASLSHPRESLTGRPNCNRQFERAYRRLGSGARTWLAETGGAAQWRVSGTLDVPAAGEGPLDVWAAPGGGILRASWLPGGSMVQFVLPEEPARKARETFARKLEGWIEGGRAARAPASSYVTSNTPVTVRPLAPKPGEPDLSLVTVVPAGVLYQFELELSDPDVPRETRAESILARNLVKAIPFVVLVLATTVLFGVLVFKRRLHFRIGLALGAAAAVTMLVGGLPTDAVSGGWWATSALILTYAASVAFLVALWVVAESLVRDTAPAFTTSLDSFATGQVGPRGGRALLAGLGAGAALLGTSLLGLSAAALAVRSGVHPSGPSFPFPLFSGLKNPVWEGTFDCALFVLFVALFRFVLPRRFASAAGAGAFALYVSNGIPLEPWGAAFALALALAAILLFVFDGYGLAALLAATLSSTLLRDTAVAALSLPEEVLQGVIAFAALALFAVVGVVALRRPEREDESRVEVPEYVRRLESERRVKYEMDLLSRMQLSLLPEKPPTVPGLELGVKTLLATEAGGDLYQFLTDGDGGLWIAAGDVSGHGYSCGIQQAMAMAAIASLVKAGRTPSGILLEVDRVLRMGNSARQFTSLVLLRVDPKSGSGVLANAGHPYPVLLADGRAREIATAGLPLGQGPARTYADVDFGIPPGGVLVLASDGLFEGLDRFDDPYGYDRPRAVLEGVGLFRRPPDAILEALFADWRRHVGDGPPSDDTTVLVVKRPLF